jgi:hypothetical protein
MDKILFLFFIISIIIIIKIHLTKKKESFEDYLFDLKKSFCRYYKQDSLKLKELCPKFSKDDCNECCVWSNNQCVIGNAKYGPIKFN